MKKIFTTFLIVFSFVLSSKAQWVTIPDTAFVNWLNDPVNGLSQCMNANQMDTTCPNIMTQTIFYIPMSNILHDLTGIQYFDNLQLLDVTDNQLSFLPQMSNTLTELNCYNNQLTSLPILPNSLWSLSCYNNHLTGLPPLPNSLTQLNCNDNLLTSLPTLSNSQLSDISCNHNQLTSLPNLPNTLKDIDCTYNQLISLPELPGLLSYLACADNQLTSLPAIPESDTIVWAYNNQLTSIFSLPHSLYTFNVTNNPGLNCIPPLEKFTGNTFDIGSTGITCLPNYIEHSGNIYGIDNLPICDVFNSNSCQAYWNIDGRVYFDNNNNCIYDGSDITLENIPIQLFQGGNLMQEVISSVNGVYSFDINSFGNYQVMIDTAQIPFLISCPSNGIQSLVNTPLDSMQENIDFAMNCKPTFDIGVNCILEDSGFFSPGEIALVKVYASDLSNFYGANCLNNVGGQLVVTFNGPIQYYSYEINSLPPSSVAGNTITWNIADFGQIDFFHDFNINFLTDTSATIGDFVCIDATVTANPADVNQSNNHLNQCFTVVASFDPNVKEVSPQELTSTNDWLTYTIHFQNTGTAPAQHIQILDTLDSDLDVSTFQLLAYSHPNMTQVLEGGIVHFNFPNINLPDSTSNEPASHGYIQYKIKPVAGTPLTSSFDNTASIYFDFNSPVVTNTTHTSFASGVHELPIQNELLIYPNPVTDNVTIKLQNGIPMNQIEITDVLGRKIYSEQTNLKSVICNLKSLSSGVYFIKVQSQNGEILVKKMVKQ